MKEEDQEKIRRREEVEEASRTREVRNRRPSKRMSKQPRPSVTSRRDDDDTPAIDGRSTLTTASGDEVSWGIAPTAGQQTELSRLHGGVVSGSQPCVTRTKCCGLRLWVVRSEFQRPQRGLGESQRGPSPETRVDWGTIGSLPAEGKRRKRISRGTPTSSLQCPSIREYSRRKARYGSRSRLASVPVSPHILSNWRACLRWRGGAFGCLPRCRSLRGSWH